jgi:hypothetical protein
VDYALGRHNLPKLPSADGGNPRRDQRWSTFLKHHAGPSSYVRTKHLQQISTRIAIRWHEGVESKS